jgi:four helix bundle protein
MAFKFEELKVWQRAVELTGRVSQLTKTFPKEEMYVLSSQMKRATDSIALNIAEGSTGSSNKQFNNFLGHALRSAIEVVTCLHIGKRRNIIPKQDFDELYEELTIIIKMIQALRKSLKIEKP